MFKRDELVRIMRDCGMSAESMISGSQTLTDRDFFSIFGSTLS